MTTVKKYLLITLISIRLLGNDIDHFAYRADQISKLIHINIYKTSKKGESKDDNKFEHQVNYDISINGHAFTFKFLGKGYKNLEKAYDSSRNEQLSFRVFEQELWLGREMILERSYDRLTKDTNDRLISLFKDYYQVNELLVDEQIKKNRINQLMNQINDLNSLQQDNRSMAGGKIIFSMQNPVLPEIAKSTRKLKIGAQVIEGQNPSANVVGLPDITKSIEKSWEVDQRLGIQTIDDLQQIGLIDNTKLVCARISLYHLPIDIWWPGHEPSNNVHPLTLGLLIPGWDAGPKSIVVGQSWLCSEFSPVRSMNEQGQSLATFMVPKESPIPLNIQVPLTKEKNGQNFSIPGGVAEPIFPIAGMDEDDRVFVLTWVAISGGNGVLFAVQYDDESRARIAYIDPSGIIFRIKDGVIEAGVRALIDPKNKTKNRSTSTLLWNGNTPSQSLTFEGTLGELKPTFMVIKSLGHYRHDTAELQSDKHGWDLMVYHFVMPRSLW